MKIYIKRYVFRVTALILLTLIAIPTTADAIFGKKRKTDDYFRWRQHITWESEDAYYIPKNAIIANTRVNVIAGYNYVVSNEGVFTKNKLKWIYDCSAMPGWSIGRIIETKKDSNVVKIQFEMPFSNKLVVEKYIVVTMIMSLRDYKKRLAK